MPAPHRPPHCTAQPGQECWECYEGFAARTCQATIVAAKAEVRWLAEAFLWVAPTADGQGYAIDLAHSARQYSDAINDQWRQMVREPFNFPPPPRELSGDELLAELGLTPVFSEADLQSLNF